MAKAMGLYDILMMTYRFCQVNFFLDSLFSIRLLHHPFLFDDLDRNLFGWIIDALGKVHVGSGSMSQLFDYLILIVENWSILKALSWCLNHALCALSTLWPLFNFWFLQVLS